MRLTRRNERRCRHSVHWTAYCAMLWSTSAYVLSATLSATAFAATDFSSGVRTFVENHTGKPLLIVAVESVDCLSCRKQIFDLVDALAAYKNWPRTVVESSDSIVRLTEFQNQQGLRNVEFLSDPNSEFLDEYT